LDIIWINKGESNQGAGFLRHRVVSTGYLFRNLCYTGAEERGGEEEGRGGGEEVQ
jgi:hypothetical protein